MTFLIYLLVFIAALLVDVVLFIGPPAWTVMVFFQLQFGLNIWLVLIVGVTGSAIGRYIYSLYIPLISERIIKPSKNADLQFIGGKFSQKGWKALLFVFIYTLMPLPSTPLFTAVGIARIKTLRILPSFFAGKFISDAAMVLTGNYVAGNASEIGTKFLSWQNVVGIGLGLVIIALFLFIDWWRLLVDKEFRLNFRIWN
jgi:membrane protein DedA with SNARE-associated domain